MRIRSLLAVCVGLALLGGACSSSDGDAAAPPPTGVIDTPSGDACTDGTGDLLVSATDTGDLRSEPAGIDITTAEAALGEDDLTISFTTLQPIESAPDALFLVQHGDLIQSPSLSWEVRIEEEGGLWVATLITVPQVGREESTTLSAPVTVSGTELSVTIPRDDLPQISSRIWSFGSSAGVSAVNRVFDECLPFVEGPTTGSSSPSSVPTETVPPVTGPVGTALEGPDGSQVTVHAVEAPAVPDPEFTLEAVVGTQFVTADVEVCATDRQLDDVGESRFIIELDNGDTRGVVALEESPHQPQFPLGVSLRPGDCERGWITFQVAIDTAVTSIAYDVSGEGVGPLLIATT